MNEKLKEKTREALTSVLPITVIVLMLSVTLVPMEVGTLALFLTGAVLLIVGMGFFQLGAEISMTPLGQGIGGSIVRQKKTWLAVVICFAMGAIITISEPDLQVLANQVAAIPNAVLIWTVAACSPPWRCCAFCTACRCPKCCWGCICCCSWCPFLSPMNFWPSPLMPAASPPAP